MRVYLYLLLSGLTCNWLYALSTGITLQYVEECDSSVPTPKNRSVYVNNIKPSASGPSAARVRAQSTSSIPLSSSLPGLTVPEVDPYDADTDIDTNVHVETPQESATKPTKSTSKKGSINITSHTLKKTKTSRKYKCRMCAEKLSSVKELTIHHQTTHHILYCSMCSKAFNNPLSLARHEYEHKHHNHKCPKCDCTFAFESQVKAQMFSHHKNPSFFCVHPGCTRAFFNESDLTRHSKRHNGKWYQCIDCPYKDTDKRNYDSHSLSHSRIANYRCEDCGKEVVYNTQKRRHIRDNKCPVRFSKSPTY